MQTKKTDHKYSDSLIKPQLLRALVLGLLCVFVSGCASGDKPEEPTPRAKESKNELGPYERYEQEEHGPSVVEQAPVSDPIEPFNRAMFHFNDYLYSYLLSPLAEGYRYVLPDFLLSGVSRMFTNLREPLYSLNFLFRLEFEKSASSLGRLATNSTLGLFGFFDPAADWFGLVGEEPTLGETLAGYGVGHGFYIVLPVLGPSDLLQAPTFAFEYLLHPLNLLENRLVARSLFVWEGFHVETPMLEKYPEVVTTKKKPYEFLRAYHMEVRKIRINQLRGKYFEADVGELSK